MAFQAFVGHALAHTIADSLGCIKEIAAYAVNTLTPWKLPCVEELIHAHQRGWLTDFQLHDNAELQCVSISPGYDPKTGFQSAMPNGPTDIWNRVYYAQQPLPTIHEYFDIANRKQISDPEVAKSLKLWGFLGERVRDDITNLRYDIPGPSDMVRFSVRHVFEPDLIKKLGYDAEYNKALDVWHQFQGLNYPIWTDVMQPYVNTFERREGLPPDYFASLYAAQNVPEPTWARAYWWSHWVLPSPTQGYLMWQRLNPLRNPVYDGPEMRGLNFSYEDLALLLRANDYPPFWRPLLAAISRPIPGIRFARDFRKQGVYDFNDLLNWALRQGYAEADAFDIAQDIENWATQAKKTKIKAQGLAQLRQAYDLGLLDLNDLPPLATAWGIDQQDLGVWMAVTEQEHSNKRAGKVLAAIRKQFLTGKIDQQGARNVLVQYGINANAINDYLADWQVEQTSHTRDVAAQKAIAWACKGVISLAELSRRLDNLGYSAVDRDAMMVEAAQCQKNLLAKIAEQQEREDEKSHKAQVAIQRHACQVFQDARRRLASHGSPNQLRKWYCEGTVGDVEVFARLRYLGWTDPDISRLLSDCKKGEISPPKVPGPTTLTGFPPAPPPGTCPPGP